MDTDYKRRRKQTDAAHRNSFPHQSNQGDLIMTDYKVHGYISRRDYLESLCEEYPRSHVFALASVLGESEDFD